MDGLLYPHTAPFVLWSGYNLFRMHGWKRSVWQVRWKCCRTKRNVGYIFAVRTLYHNFNEHRLSTTLLKALVVLEPHSVAPNDGHFVAHATDS
jgi:hypothetical protein